MTTRHLPVSRYGLALMLLCAVAAAFLFLAMALIGVAGLAGVLTLAPTSTPAPGTTPVILVLSMPAATPHAALPEASTLREHMDTSVVQPSQPLHATVPVEPVLVPTPRPLTYRDIFQEVGAAYEIDWRLLAALAFHESRLDAQAVGRDGDMGLMQILPTTWQEFAPSITTDPFDPYSNAQVAATYLLYIQEYLAAWNHHDLRWVLAAYNWGPERTRQFLNNGGDWSTLPERQQRYVANILESAFGVQP